MSTPQHKAARRRGVSRLACSAARLARLADFAFTRRRTVVVAWVIALVTRSALPGSPATGRPTTRRPDRTRARPRPAAGALPAGHAATRSTSSGRRATAPTAPRRALDRSADGGATVWMASPRGAGQRRRCSRRRNDRRPADAADLASGGDPPSSGKRLISLPRAPTATLHVEVGGRVIANARRPRSPRRWSVWRSPRSCCC